MEPFPVNIFIFVGDRNLSNWKLELFASKGLTRERYGASCQKPIRTNSKQYSIVAKLTRS
jgi:hypothetical protein